MLFKSCFHAGLCDGSIDLTFRRWSAAKVKVGGAYRFDRKPGALVVDSIDRMPFGKITKREATRAGFESLDDLKDALQRPGAGVTPRTSVFRVAFHFDRSAGRNSAAVKPTEDAVAALVERLRRMDRLSPRGRWTKEVLGLIAKHPQRRAGDLAPRVDRELRAFKADVRKLKGINRRRARPVERTMSRQQR